MSYNPEPATDQPEAALDEPAAALDAPESDSPEADQGDAATTRKYY